MYHNTTNLSGEDLEDAHKITSEQDKVVLELFQNRPNEYLDSHKVEALLEVYPRSSIVRSINTLTNMGLIKKTDKQIIGKYGKLVYTWKLVPREEKQSELFNISEFNNGYSN